jgi:protein MBA1
MRRWKETDSMFEAGIKSPWHGFDLKANANHRRYYYRACIQKSGWTKYLPVDIFNNSQYKAIAKKHYEQIQKNFASYVPPSPSPAAIFTKTRN